ncbi:MAG: 50S ribosomal protein L29 [Gammaproteobacteria bacterium]
MEAKELKSKSSEELETLLLDLRKEQFSLRMQQGTGQANNPHLFKNLRKDIARVKTVLNENNSGN